MDNHPEQVAAFMTIADKIIATSPLFTSYTLAGSGNTGVFMDFHTTNNTFEVGAERIDEDLDPWVKGTWLVNVTVGDAFVSLEGLDEQIVAAFMDLPRRLELT